MDDASLCQGPDPNPRAPRFRMPKGAVDCHAHVIADPSAGPPFVAGRSYTPPAASLDSYFAMHDALGIARGVLVQISVYGTDNRVMVEALKRAPKRLRGIGVVPPDVSERELESLDRAGVRGLRLNILFGGGVGLDAMETLAQRIKGLGWHIQLLLDATNLHELAPRLEKLPVPFAIDHFGNFPTRLGVAHRGFQTLVGLARGADCWVKISGANRTSPGPIPYRDTIPFARALVEAAPGRLVWGTDWPHVSEQKPMPNDGDLLDLLAEWVPDEATRNRILVENPMRLYGFPSP
ncbi:MAG TPA: amidohydrolase family protein [Alphaproteobacteria bacterium]|nr:amidohydrolase family protein [Alphaproteobacteria bacterium]